MERFTKGEWSIERHGAGFALYAGRTGMAHGLNLFNIAEPDKNFESNASLIAAAPEMYEMLASIKLLAEYGYSHSETGFELISMMSELNSLLAKARGEQ